MDNLPWDEVSVQRDISMCFAHEVLESIIEEIGDGVFGLLVDDSSDGSTKRVVVVLRYVDACGIVKERFVGLVDVTEMSAIAIKTAVESLFNDFGVSLKRARGQGYAGASKMRAEFRDLKDLIVRENNSAYYVHCFADDLQVVVEAIAKEHSGVRDFFDMIDLLMNAVSTSCKVKDMVRESLRKKVEEAVGCGGIQTESGLKLDYRYKTLLNLVELFPSVIEVLEYVEKEGKNDLRRRQASDLQVYFHSYDFVFNLHLMLHILELTDLSSQAFKRKDQDIVNAISLVKSTKEQMRKFRVDGFNSLLKKISSFCEKHDIEILNMKKDYANPRNRRQKTSITNQQYYEFDCLNKVVDMQIQELDDRFSEVSSELLHCMAALSPCNSFHEFDPLKLLRLSELYADDFSCRERMTLKHQLDLYIDNVQKDGRFNNLNGFADLARVMVDTKSHLSHPLVYQLLKLVLVLPVANATIERCFSTIKLVKSDLRKRIDDEFLNIYMISAIEKEALANVTNESVMDRFEQMKIRREQL